MEDKFNWTLFFAWFLAIVVGCVVTKLINGLLICWPVVARMAVLTLIFFIGVGAVLAAAYMIYFIFDIMKNK